MYVIITLPLGYAYGPYVSSEEARAVANSAAFKKFDVGEVRIRAMLGPEQCGMRKNRSKKNASTQG